MLISVVIPVYNAEKYLHRCIESILAQTYSNWEIIMVNDGSMDNSWKIMSEYAQKDKRIKALQQENKGAGLARNLAMEYLQGEYVVFIDADDFIEPSYFDLLIKHSEDIVFIDAKRRNEKGNVVVIEKVSVNKGRSKDDILRSQMTGKTPWAGWRKATKVELIKKYDIKYTEHKVGEEAIFSFLLLFYAKTFSYIDIPVYNYEVHGGSLSQTLIDDPWGQVALVLKETIEGLGVYDEYADTLNSFIKTAAVVSLDKMARKYKYSEYCTLATERVERMKREVDLTQRTDYKNMDIKAKFLLPFMRYGLLGVIYFVSNLRKMRG